MAASVADLVRKFEKAAGTVNDAQLESVKAVSLMAKNVMISGAESVNTPRTINTRRGKKRNAWGVRYLIFTSKTAPLTTVFYYGGPPYWRERGIQPHLIEPSGKKQALKFNGLYSTGAEHPGVSSRPFWSPTKDRVQKQSGEVYRRANVAAMVKAGFGT